MYCTVCMTSYEFYWHHNHSLWHPKTVFMTSHPHYSWHQTHCIWHHIHSTCDITATQTMTIQLLYFWRYTQCIWHLKFWMNDTKKLYLIWYPMYLCNQTHLIDDFTPFVWIKSHPLHVWHHRNFIWHHIHSCWQQSIVCMSWHTLLMTSYIIYILYTMSPIQCVWLPNLYIWLETRQNCHLIHSVCHHTLSVEDITPPV